MKQKRLITVASLFGCLFLLASFNLPFKNGFSHGSMTEKNLVFKVSYDASMDRLNASEKVEVSKEMVERNMEGKVVNVNRQSIVTEMRLSGRAMHSMINMKKKVKGEMYALVSYRQSADSEKATDAPSDDQLFEYLKASFRSYSRNSFRGSDFNVAEKSWNCSGGSCSDAVPFGVDVFVWEE